MEHTHELHFTNHDSRNFIVYTYSTVAAAEIHTLKSDSDCLVSLFAIAHPIMALCNYYVLTNLTVVFL